MNIFFTVLGCRANFAENQVWEDLVLSLGSNITNDINNADVCIINTCTVTDSADKKSAKQIKDLIKKNPDTTMIITGCSINAEENHLPKESDKIKYIDRYKIAKNLTEIINSKTEDLNFQTSDITLSKTRSFLKIQDGCNNFCSYCIIPLTRGREKSIDVEDIINEVRKRESQGYKEIVLTGIHLSNWGSDVGFKKGDLTSVLMNILDQTSIPRIRFGSLEPRFFNNSFINMLNEERVCPHLHLSLQSGSEETLKAMRRHYTAEEYRNIVMDLFERVGDFNLTTDLIVGFPGETEELFQESMEFIKNIPFSKIHTFPYSKRSNTAAAGMKEQVDENTKKKRSKIIRDLSDNKQKEFLQKYTGTTANILLEEKRRNIWSGLTRNYIRVWLNNNPQLKKNEFIKVKLKDIHNEGSMIGLLGEI